MNQTEVLKARQKAEKEFLSILEELDKSPTGWNVTYWKNRFKNMSNTQFTDLMKKFADDELDNKLFYQINHMSKDARPEIDDIMKHAKKRNIPIKEYIIMPDDNRDNPSMPSVTKNEQLMFIVPVRKHQQTKDHKNKISNNNNKLNSLTGQAIDDSKAARFSDNEMFSLNASGQINVIKELLGPRGDDAKAQRKMEEQIRTFGRCTLSELNMKTVDKQSVRTMVVFLNAAGLDVIF